jgi:hypothetical protein
MERKWGCHHKLCRTVNAQHGWAFSLECNIVKRKLTALRARGQLTELRQSDLRFTTGEAAAFLNRVMGLNLFSDHATALESRTETRVACQSPLTITS